MSSEKSSREDLCEGFVDGLEHENEYNEDSEDVNNGRRATADCESVSISKNWKSFLWRAMECSKVEGENLAGRFEIYVEI